MQEDSGPGEEHVALAGPNPEHMDEDLYATAYPKVHENPKLRTDEHVILENPESSSATLSSMKNLDETNNFGDQFLNDKPTEDDHGENKCIPTHPPNNLITTLPKSLHSSPSAKIVEIGTRKSKVKRRLSLYACTGFYSNPQVPTVLKLVGTKIDESLLKALERHTADLVEKYSVLPAPESSKKQESEKSPKEIIRIKSRTSLRKRTRANVYYQVD
ncbi:hypothetical protein Tco_0748909 [Tanacetum coccineum]|uniref:Uncharacterized protein n=1 Tax=Tanacetum coccineum TaxID=301880 RepID=A0ABQ4YZY2_9ASTR